MHITVNADLHEITSETLADVLDELGFADPAIATALNGVFVARDVRPATVLAEGDRLEVLAPMQGG